MKDEPEQKMDADQQENDLFSLHQSVTNTLRRRVLEGHFSFGSKLPSLRKFAEEFKVSTMTVRRAFLSLEREGLLTRLPSVGVFARPNLPDKVTAHKRVAYVSVDLNNAFDTALISGIEKACQNYGWSLQIFDAHLDVDTESRNIQRLADLAIHGSQGAIILPPWNPLNIDMLFRIQSDNYPIILLDRIIPGLKMDLVSSDHEGGAYLATNYLLQKGHSRIFMLTHQPLSSSVSARLRGYERALRETGIKVLPERKVFIDPETQDLGYSENKRWWGGYSAMLPVLKKIKPPAAVLAIDSYSSIGVYEACYELGLRIPDDISVIGFDDSEIVHMAKPPMTIIAQRTDEIGLAAVELLERRIGVVSNNDSHRTICTNVTIDIDLIERQSVASLHDT
ncbi:MAG: GntR family transcriptional regulator [Planctomycetota bacterium]|jgi:DNA-binding LacI/PurR family transcriptional regulator